MKILSYSIIASGLLFFACGEKSDPTPPAECEIGSEGCECTTGGSCDDDLECLSDVCVDTESGSGGDNSGGAEGTGGSDESGGSGGGNATGGSAPEDFDDCVPYSDHSDCESNEWCIDGADSSSPAVCREIAGTSKAGDPCDGGNDTCESGTLCLPTPAGELCHTVCDPSAQGADEKLCGTQQDCVPFEAPDADQDNLTLGICFDGCDYHNQTACLDDGLVCFPGELAGETSRDTCGFDVVTEIADYASCDFSPLSHCSTDSLCLDVSDPLEGTNKQCVPLCFESEAAFGSNNHPDCPTTTASCLQLGESLVGLCVEPT